MQTKRIGGILNKGILRAQFFCYLKRSKLDECINLILEK